MDDLADFEPLEHGGDDEDALFCALDEFDALESPPSERERAQEQDEVFVEEQNWVFPFGHSEQATPVDPTATRSSRPDSLSDPSASLPLSPPLSPVANGSKRTVTYKDGPCEPSPKASKKSRLRQTSSPLRRVLTPPLEPESPPLPPTPGSPFRPSEENIDLFFGCVAPVDPAALAPPASSRGRTAAEKVTGGAEPPPSELKVDAQSSDTAQAQVAPAQPIQRRAITDQADAVFQLWPIPTLSISGKPLTSIEKRCTDVFSL